MSQPLLARLGEYRIGAVCQWIGDTKLIAAKHYLQPCDAGFEQMAMRPKTAAQNPTQQMTGIRGVVKRYAYKINKGSK